ncbi:MAG TPA: hypothetical protein PLX89_08020 [Verrucomicrobiota bacterium]|nr:hypothetical protein [Verrucomicrobiota bacterium]
MSTLVVILLSGLFIGAFTLFVLAACAAGARADRQLGYDVEGEEPGPSVEPTATLQNKELESSGGSGGTRAEQDSQSRAAVPRRSPGSRIWSKVGWGRRDAAAP